jgi:hypothetical protein
MNVIQTFNQLKDYTLFGCKQFWYYVILINPHDLTQAGRPVFDNLDIFHLDSGKECQYFIPGFLNTGRGIFEGRLGSFLAWHSRDINIPNFGRLQFNAQNFVDFYLELEQRNSCGWRYSGECELLLFNLSMGNKIKLNNFISYNLDDIVRNGRNVSEFIRTTINVGKDATDAVEAKRILDEKFSDLIMPQMDKVDLSVFERGWNILQNNGFQDNSYMFISYSSKDFHLVSDVRQRLMKAGISCWMAPYDIPSGFNYALVIEHAILHAERFVLMLSPSAAQSVWVGKELKRAIARFQLEAPDKIRVVWLDRPFQLTGTPLALPLEDIQSVAQLHNNPNNYFLLASEEKQTEIKRKQKIQKQQEELALLLAPETVTQNFREIISRIRCIHSLSSGLQENPQLLSLCAQILSEIDAMEQSGDIRNQEFSRHYMHAVELLNHFSQFPELKL